MSESNKCDCVEMSCKKDCAKSHTHKGFFCKKCHSTTPSWEGWVRTLANSNNPHDVDLLVAKIKVLLESQREDMVALGEGLKKEQTAHIGIDTITGAFDSLSYNQAITAYQSLLAKK